MVLVLPCSHHCILGLAQQTFRGKPQCERNAVPDWELGCVQDRQGMRNKGLTCLQPTAIQLTSTILASPCSAPGSCLAQVVQTLVIQPQHAQVTNTPGAVPETDCSSASGSTCRCFNQLEKDKRCLNIAK